MARLRQRYVNPGFYGIGIHCARSEENVGTLWRSAYILGAAFIFTVGGRRYHHQGSDVTQAWTKIPLYHYEDIDDLRRHLPHDTRLVAVEMAPDAHPLPDYRHPEQAVYLLGNEQSGLPEPVVAACHETLCLPGHFSLNVAVAGSIVLYDRVAKHGRELPRRAES